MKTYSVSVLSLAVLFMLPLVANAQSKPSSGASSSKLHQAKTTTSMYECPICHHKASAALAKKLHYVCPMDNGKLALVKTASLHKP
jgi:hypothetical protein